MESGCHREERSDEAIQEPRVPYGLWTASLAMTPQE
jgi:hypothetical protein